MADLLAAKTLTASDLTFFERQFRTLSAGNQKSINLNADILVGELYPDLEAVAARSGGEIRFPLTIYGPNGAQAYRLTRKIIKNKAYKNWRLNGEFVFDPEDEPGRFDQLRPGDLAVFGFTGRPAPDAITMVLLAASAAADAMLHNKLSRAVPGARRTMVTLTTDEIANALSQPHVPADHPLSVLAVDRIVDIALEDAIQAGLRGTRFLQRRRAARPVTADELDCARRAMDRTGAEGEALVNALLASTRNRGGEFEHVWESARNAITPFDFYCESRRGAMGDRKMKIDVKSTRGPFESDFHLSLAEAVEAASSPIPYHIWRVFRLSDDGADLRRSEDIRAFAKALVAAHDDAMPGNVQADSFSVPVDAPGLAWLPTDRLDRRDAEDETPVFRSTP